MHTSDWTDIFMMRQSSQAHTLKDMQKELAEIELSKSKMTAPGNDVFGSNKSTMRASVDFH